jgi:5'-3' exonuclease
MGVPAFFRWLSRKYPSVIIECNEKKVRKASNIKKINEKNKIFLNLSKLTKQPEKISMKMLRFLIQMI